MSYDVDVIYLQIHENCAEIGTVTRDLTPMGTGFPDRESGLSADTIAVAADGGPASAGPSPATGPGIQAAMAARSAGENFPVALRLLPARHRQHLMAVYGFARTADDIGDRAPVAERARLLDELEADLGRLYASLPDADGAGAGLPDADRAGAGGPAADQAAAGHRGEAGHRDAGQGGGPELSVIRALGPVVSQCAIPPQPFLDLIQANRQDQLVTRYPTFDDLQGYCRLSANPVGRIVLYAFGAFSPARAALSDQVCTALQLAEHWQDVGEDFRAGRIYLPGEDMTRYGCAESDLSAPRSSPALRALVGFETQRARALLDAGAPLVGTLRGFARAAVAGYVAGGRAALAAIAAADHDVLRATPRPRARRTVAELLRCYATGR
jgi:squalene synthase HpnC